MRVALLLLATLITVPAQAPGEKQYQTGYCPETAELGVSPQGKYWFEGMIGAKHVRMYLERGGGGVVGAFYDTTAWDPLTLGGRWSGGETGTIELTARTEHDAAVGSLKGDLTAEGLSGVWTARGESGVEFHLKVATQPKCDGKESWKVFNDAQWPVTFSYPHTWHVSAGAETVTLTCPDPSLMAYDGYEIRVSQGGDANNATSDIVQCGDKWIYGYSCTCEHADRCNAAPAMERAGMTVLRADSREWRVYCRGGGYVGQGTGDRRILTFGDTWIVVEAQGPAAELVERVVGTAKRKK